MKDKRLHVRCTNNQERAIKHAATIEGLTVTDFILQAGIDRAHQTIKKYHVIEVTLDQCDKMMAAADCAKMHPESEDDLIKRSIIDNMNPTLRWLAENVSEWGNPKRNLISVFNGKVIYPKTTYFCGYPFTREDWLKARKSLGLV